MNTRRLRIGAQWYSLPLLTLAAVAAGGTPHSPQVITIDVHHESAPVSSHEYGMFIEPIGGLIARTLWAEMLDDRKFFFPVQSQSKDVAPPPSVEGRPGVRYRQWRPIGGGQRASLRNRRQRAESG
jgi:alpha-L-arabinofuranosidase